MPAVEPLSAELAALAQSPAAANRLADLRLMLTTSDPAHLAHLATRLAEAATIAIADPTATLTEADRQTLGTVTHAVSAALMSPAQRGEYARWLESHKPIRQLTCAVCGKAFASRGSRARFCGATCRQKAHYDRTRVRANESRAGGGA